MRARRVACGAILSALILAGCATAYMEGRQALYRGNYDEAAQRFEQILTEEPGRLDALAGLGIARYKQGAWDLAIQALEGVVGQRPENAEARLYLALSHLQKGDAAAADSQLVALRQLALDPRFVAQIDRATTVLRSGTLTEAVRSFVATSLESAADLVRELRWAQLEVERARLLATPPPCTLVRRHGILYCL
ncbi:MAG TPA: tetratricopeptide repeat protein [Methylomirabilota bacterium]|jgi:tetratricopeptide (TPR) repeat protein|nr:tetratricopeptide repeat protein [Methylomirabilota bacterium]